jgi:hypothetical protein
MPETPKLRLMVASTVYNFEDQLRQLCAILTGYGYEVWNSHIGTIPVHPGRSNLENCVAAARNCDVLLGIVRPFYGSGKVGSRSITHEECREAIRLKKPRWFLVHRNVTLARQLLKPYMYKKDGTRTKFTLKTNPILDDIRVIGLYEDVIQNNVTPAKRKGQWVQEFDRLEEALVYINTQFRDAEHIRTICKEMRKP